MTFEELLTLAEKCDRLIEKYAKNLNGHVLPPIIVPVAELEFGRNFFSG